MFLFLPNWLYIEAYAENIVTNYLQFWLSQWILSSLFVLKPVILQSHIHQITVDTTFYLSNQITEDRSTVWKIYGIVPDKMIKRKIHIRYHYKINQIHSFVTSCRPATWSACFPELIFQKLLPELYVIFCIYLCLWFLKVPISMSDLGNVHHINN